MMILALNVLILSSDAELPHNWRIISCPRPSVSKAVARETRFFRRIPTVPRSGEVWQRDRKRTKNRHSCETMRQILDLRQTLDDRLCNVLSSVTAKLVDIHSQHQYS